MTLKMTALDWRSMKLYQIRGLLLPVFIAVMAFYSPVAVIPLSAMMFLVFSINPFAVEEKGELNSLYLSMPVSRRAVVNGRYVLSLTMLVCGIISGVIIMLISNIYAMSKWYVGVKGIIFLISVSLLFYSLLNLFMFPVLFRLGYQKGKFWGFYLPAVFCSLLFGGYTGIASTPKFQSLTLKAIEYAANNLLIISGGAAILAAVILLFSYLLSVKMYSKRDF
jgi:ABC-2 type transport system permease protein